MLSRKTFTLRIISAFIIMLISLSLVTINVYAAYLVNEPVTATQPNGAVLSLFATGDEYYRRVHDENGYTIVQDPVTGYYVYAALVNDELVPTEFVVDTTDPATTGLEPNLNLSPEKIGEIRLKKMEEMTPPPVEDKTGSGPILNAPTTGTINNLVIFVRFADEAEFSDNTSFYTNMFNSDPVGGNSLLEYFQEVSYNTLTVSSSLYPTPPGTTVISYQDPTNPRAYYQPYHVTDNPIGYQTDTEKRLREHGLLRDAINHVNGLGQFPTGTTIDGDNDGLVDSITFIISGATDGWSDLLWPHKWSLYSYDVYIDSRLVNEYAMQFNSTLNNGVLAHEMFHVLGAPDLYHYTDNGIAPVYSWDLMEWNQNPPQHMGCYMKYRYGHWISSIPQITTPGTYSLNPLTSSTNNCYRIASPYSTSEFFLVEYRSQTGTFENSLPGSGLLIYRIDSTQDGQGNRNGPPDEVYIYRPDGTTAVNGSPALAHFSSNVSRIEINGQTNPTAFLTSGSSGGLSICNIGSSGGTISFDVGNCTPLSVSPASFDFGDHLAGSTSNAQSFTVTNNGGSSITLGTLSVVGDFGISNDLCSSQTLIASGTCTFDVTFSPAAPGTRSGGVAIPSNDGNSPDSVYLTGNGLTPTTLYAAPTATGSGNCLSWANACTLQTALGIASSGQQVWVQAGVHKPGTNRTDTFSLRSGVEVYGGFAGTETALNQRNITANITILSGDIDNNDTNTDNNNVAETPADIVGANSYHVVTGGGSDSTGRLDGFTITAGQANGTNPNNFGGGFLLINSSPVLSNLVIQGNTATYGGGMYNQASSPQITNLFISGNLATDYGGGIYNNQSSNPVLNNAIFNNNSSPRGAGLYNYSSNPTLTNVSFSSNSASAWGGGIYNYTSSPTLANVILWGNTATNGSIAQQQIYNNSSTPTISYSDIQGSGGSGASWATILGTDGGGNIASDPLFIDAPNGNLRLNFGSPAIDTGTNTGCSATDLDSLGRPNDGNADSSAACDMGAYEAGTMVCSVTQSNTYDFSNHSSISILTTTQMGDLNCLYVDEMEISHPNATGTIGETGIMTGKYWLIRGLQADRTTNASGYNVNLTLPHNGLTSPEVCKYPGELGGYGWDCSSNASTTSTVTRNGVVSFSDWAVGEQVGPTAIQLKDIGSRSNVSLLWGLLPLLAFFGFAGLIWTTRRYK